MLYNAINKILIEEDIEGYIDFGAPIDEYQSEAQLIADLLTSDIAASEKVTVETLYKILHDIWQKSFNLSEEEMLLRRENLTRTASRITMIVN